MMREGDQIARAIIREIDWRRGRSAIKWIHMRRELAIGIGSIAVRLFISVVIHGMG